MHERPVRVSEAAQEEIRQAELWYWEQSEAAALSFDQEIQQSLSRLREFPGIGPKNDNTRRWLMFRFPYAIIYRIEEDHILIVALAHQAQKPGYWHSRL